MRTGFIFNKNLCVGCGACKVACVLENGMQVQPRTLYSSNPGVVRGLPLINLSLACNHCEKAPCMDGCPTGSIYRDKLSGAIIIDELKCIGCRYCQWNCPFDAPKYDYKNGVAGKCHKCYKQLNEGRLPACSSGCPTGALDFGSIPDSQPGKMPAWFPDKNLNPAIEFPAPGNATSLKIVPESRFDNSFNKTSEKVKGPFTEWSLAGFSYLVTLSVAYLSSSLFSGKIPDIKLYIILILLAAMLSIFHLGRIMRAWRAVFNLKTSNLSREIAVFLFYSIVSVAALYFELPALIAASSLIGLVLLLVIDSVYLFADRRLPVILHSGQTFLSSLIIISFLTGNIIAFAFIALFKLSSSVYRLLSGNGTGINFMLRFMRLVFLIITLAGLITGQSNSDQVILSLFLAGELIDRFLFYIDFEPLNINTSIQNHKYISIYEKKRG